MNPANTHQYTTSRHASSLKSGDLPIPLDNLIISCGLTLGRWHRWWKIVSGELKNPTAKGPPHTFSCTLLHPPQFSSRFQPPRFCDLPFRVYPPPYASVTTLSAQRVDCESVRILRTVLGAQHPPIRTRTRPYSFAQYATDEAKEGFGTANETGGLGSGDENDWPQAGEA